MSAVVVKCHGPRSDVRWSWMIPLALFGEPQTGIHSRFLPWIMGWDQLQNTDEQRDYLRTYWGYVLWPHQNHRKDLRIHIQPPKGVGPSAEECPFGFFYLSATQLVAAAGKGTNHMPPFSNVMNQVVRDLPFIQARELIFLENAQLIKANYILILFLFSSLSWLVRLFLSLFFKCVHVVMYTYAVYKPAWHGRYLHSGLCLTSNDPSW